MGVRLCAACVAAQMVLLALATGASASPACPADDALPTPDNAYDTAMSVVCDINAVRADNGLRPLQWDWRLETAAQRMADDMAARHYIAHVTPDGTTLADRIDATGYIPSSPTWVLAENLGWGTSVLSTPFAITVGWMNSTEHRENILDPALEDIGIGVQMGAISDGGQDGAIYVADFGSRGVAVAATNSTSQPSSAPAAPEPASAAPTAARQSWWRRVMRAHFRRGGRPTRRFGRAQKRLALARFR